MKMITVYFVWCCHGPFPFDIGPEFAAIF